MACMALLSTGKQVIPRNCIEIQINFAVACSHGFELEHIESPYNIIYLGAILTLPEIEMINHDPNSHFVCMITHKRF